MSNVRRETEGRLSPDYAQTTAGCLMVVNGDGPFL